MLKKKKTKTPDTDKKFIVPLRLLSILILSLINIYLLYNIFSVLLHAFNKSDKENQSKLVAADIQVEVLNGCGVSGIADKLTDFLREKKKDVVNVGNYSSFEIEKSIIIDRIGNYINAQNIANVIGLDDTNIIHQINKDYLLDVTIILGRDYSILIPLKKRF